MASHMDVWVADMEMLGLPIISVMVVDDFDTFCSVCGGGVDPEEIHHDTLLRGQAGPPEMGAGCHAKFVAKTSRRRFEADIAHLRTDLPYVTV